MDLMEGMEDMEEIFTHRKIIFAMEDLKIHKFKHGNCLKIFPVGKETMSLKLEKVLFMVQVSPPKSSNLMLMLEIKNIGKNLNYPMMEIMFWNLSMHQEINLVIEKVLSMFFLMDIKFWQSNQIAEILEKRLSQ